MGVLYLRKWSGMFIEFLIDSMHKTIALGNLHSKNQWVFVCPFKANTHWWPHWRWIWVNKTAFRKSYVYGYLIAAILIVGFGDEVQNRDGEDGHCIYN